MKGSSSYFGLIALAAFMLVSPSSCKRIKDNIYRPLKDVSFGFKRANGTHEMGATSELGGNVGVLHIVKQKKDLDWVVERGPHEPYIAVLSPRMFNRETLIKLKNSSKVNGIILLLNLNDTEWTIPEKYSDDNVCPNSPGSLYAPGEAEFCSEGSKPWNPYGSNVLNENWPFPIFKISNSENVDFILKCYKDFNEPTSPDDTPRDWPLCAAELESHMYLSVDSPTCLRRTSNGNSNPFSPTMYCDKLGDRNVFMLLDDSKNDRPITYPNKSVIVLSTKLDVVTFFDGAEFGAQSPVTGIVALLTIANVLNEALKNLKFENGVENILFAFFNGEAFDYIGSSRAAYDMARGEFPMASNPKLDKQWPTITPESIKLVLEIGQLFDLAQRGYFAHVDKKFTEEDLLQTLINLPKPDDIKIQAASARVLPPSSLQGILKESRTVPGILVNNYDEEFQNPYFNSVYDNYTRLGYNYDQGEDQEIVRSLSKISRVLSAYVYKLTTGKTLQDQIKPNATLINELLNCFMVTRGCSMFVEASTPETNFPKESRLPFPQYITVDRSLNFHTYMTYQVLGYLTGSSLGESFQHDNCKTPDNQTIYNYVFYKADPNYNATCEDGSKCPGDCKKITAFMTEAISPAFIIENYNFSSSRYSAWTESVWKTFSGRVFLKASPKMDAGFLTVGIIVSIFSFIIVYWVERNAETIFSDRILLAPSTTATPAHL